MQEDWERASEREREKGARREGMLRRGEERRHREGVGERSGEKL